VRVLGDKEGKDIKAMAMATRMVGKWTVMATQRAMATVTRVAGKQQQRQQRGRWQQGRRWRATKKAMAMAARAMAMATRVMGE
jgi:hypothetical protein